MLFGSSNLWSFWHRKKCFADDRWWFNWVSWKRNASLHTTCVSRYWVEMMRKALFSVSFFLLKGSFEHRRRKNSKRRIADYGCIRENWVQFKSEQPSSGVRSNLSTALSIGTLHSDECAEMENDVDSVWSFFITTALSRFILINVLVDLCIREISLS